MDDDGSVDICCGPTAPIGDEDNRIEAVPGKTWLALLRLYGPLDPWFEQTWRPDDTRPAVE